MDQERQGQQKQSTRRRSIAKRMNQRLFLYPITSWILRGGGLGIERRARGKTSGLSHRMKFRMNVMRFTSRSRSDNFHSAEREMSKPNIPGIDSSTTSSEVLLADESGDTMNDFYGNSSRNSSRSLFLLRQPLIVVLA